jgi:DNA (cytosine-5)-methyltransferase 1
MTYCPLKYPEVELMREHPEIRPILMLVRKRFSQKDISVHLGVEPRTIRRWESGETCPPPYAVDVLEQMLQPLSKAAEAAPDFTFIDLFAGIGGIRKGFEDQNGKCVFTSEWNEYAVKTYRANFTEDHPVVGDITKIDEKTIPDHDVLLAGFPCQPFSIAGVSKKNALGRPHGFLCQTQGTLFFDVARIIREMQPKAFLLENVKNLASHDGGNTFRTIMGVLRDELGYDIHHKTIDAKHFVPQHRERILIVGFRESTGFSWNQLRLPNISKNHPLMRDILHPEDGSEKAEAPFTEGPKAKVAEKYILSGHLWKYLRDYAARHKAKGNGFGYGLVGLRDIARTLSARTTRTDRRFSYPWSRKESSKVNSPGVLQTHGVRQQGPEIQDPCLGHTGIQTVRKRGCCPGDFRGCPDYEAPHYGIEGSRGVPRPPIDTICLKDVGYYRQGYLHPNGGWHPGEGYETGDSASQGIVLDMIDFFSSDHPKMSVIGFRENDYSNR